MDEVRKLWVSNGPPNMLLDPGAAVTPRGAGALGPLHTDPSLWKYGKLHIRTITPVAR